MSRAIDRSKIHAEAYPGAANDHEAAAQAAGGWRCEQHPWLAWPHDDCGGPGEGRRRFDTGAPIKVSRLEQEVFDAIRLSDRPMSAFHVQNGGLTLTVDAAGSVLRSLAGHGLIEKVGDRPARYRPAEDL